MLINPHRAAAKGAEPDLNLHQFGLGKKAEGLTIFD